jgi:hypothetical protein
MTTKAMVLYKKQPLVKVTDVRALSTRRRKRVPALELFVAWITPWFLRAFEDSLESLLKELRGYYRRDKEFRQLVTRGERGPAKRVLKELMGCLD